MLYALICQDRPDAGASRAETRQAHLDYLKSLGPKLKAAGPFLDEAGQATGSLVVVEAESEADARALSDGDPYAAAGVFASVTVRRWNWTFNNPDAA